MSGVRNATPASRRAAVSTSAAVGGAMDSDFSDMGRKVLPQAIAKQGAASGFPRASRPLCCRSQ
jgi:hypothetical protein